ncbi:pyruvate dehydrogenase (acetyl-transferring) E1 component subunit alpha [Paraburkholderia sp. UYCP14C]|uniref:pyruvate dehydrogenase (acetyl-transferring) E1 component subunit alpha n=1 Tax=Paraburkholderia sp. UYCP14C TaxID=2511130 RepID=UPI00101F3D9C|nr:pyruvate dehydrogenase (acetyl-transferring) E1 component subunit alpha [Paraburkholderia sp. UYCP14C]RZF25665.1 pyruvate dehydrogenase (acetyl-transferring) E1 component subunit alpha [Paraburkholderia sp. UYCP14C]
MTTVDHPAPAPPCGPVPYDETLARALLRDMLRVRRLEEKCAELYGAGKIRGFLHLYIGEEATGVGAIHALDADDNIVATYREHAHALLRGMDMGVLMAEMYGKLEGCAHGRGGSMHLFDRKTRLFGGNAIVGGGLPLAVGLALADTMQHAERITACFFGDGAVAEGVFHESMNLAALWQLPVLFCCENNLYAMGTALERSQSQTDLCMKAASYRIETRRADGMDIVAVHDATAQAAAYVRSKRQPLFLELQTYRFRAHSMYDAELYRDKAEVEQWKTRGPIHTFTERLKAEGRLSEAEFLALDAEVEAEVAQAVAFAEAGAWEPVEALTKYVYTQPGEES